MIKLRFKTTELIDPRYGDLPIQIIRLIGWIKLHQKDGSFSEEEVAIIDTGAFVSVIPRDIWQHLQVTIDVTEISFGGINPRPECQIPAARGRVSGFLVDEDGNRTQELTFPAFLAKTDQVPLILGFADLLARFPIHFDYESDEAYIEKK